MKPGRELDALIAERVMGWDHLADPNRIHGIIPTYSTNIAAAWEVVEKLHSGDLSGYGKRPIVLKLNTYRNNPVWCEFHLSDDHAGDDQSVWIAQGDTAPHAICLAAIKSMENE